MMKAVINIASGIGAVGQIIIKPMQIRSAASELRSLSSNVTSRNLSIDFSYSEGDVVNQLIDYADNLKKAGDAIALLIHQTATALENTANQFELTDESIASRILKEQQT